MHKGLTINAIRFENLQVQILFYLLSRDEHASCGTSSWALHDGQNCTGW